MPDWVGAMVLVDVLVVVDLDDDLVVLVVVVVVVGTATQYASPIKRLWQLEPTEEPVSFTGGKSLVYVCIHWSGNACVECENLPAGFQA